MKFIITIIFLLLETCFSFSQNIVSPEWGFHFSQNNIGIEAGISTSLTYGEPTNEMKGVKNGTIERIATVYNMSISSEIYYNNSDKKFFIAPKIALWGSYGKLSYIDYGVNFIRYTDFNKSNCSIRPEIGFYFRKPGERKGLGFFGKDNDNDYDYKLHLKIKIVYGYNFFMKDNAIFPTHVFSLVFFYEGHLDFRGYYK